MLRFLADPNFDGDIVRGLLRSIPDLDLLGKQGSVLAAALTEAALNRCSGTRVI